MQFFWSSLVLAVAVSALPAEPMLGGARINARQAKVIPIVVGGPQDTFNPNSITAAVGDIVAFQFSNGNHSK
jgi:plastocyanin